MPLIQVYWWDYTQLVECQTTATTVLLYCIVQDLKYVLCSKYHWLSIPATDWLLDIQWGSWLQCREQLGRCLFGTVQLMEIIFTFLLFTCRNIFLIFHTNIKRISYHNSVNISTFPPDTDTSSYLSTVSTESCPHYVQNGISINRQCEISVLLLVAQFPI